MSFFFSPLPSLVPRLYLGMHILEALPQPSVQEAEPPRCHSLTEPGNEILNEILNESTLGQIYGNYQYNPFFSIQRIFKPQR
jgi:hypothetical protein